MSEVIRWLSEGEEEHGENPEDVWKAAHFVMATIAWFALENLLLWSIFFKNYRWGAMLHILFAGLLSAIFFVAALFMVVYQGWAEVKEHFLHQTAGFILLCILPFHLFTGGFAKFSQLSAYKNPKIVVVANWVHFLLGWFMIIWSKIVMYSAWRYWEQEKGREHRWAVFIPILIVDMISHILFIILKSAKKSREVDATQKHKPYKGSLRDIRSSKDLKVYGDKYFIFGNQVFNISPLMNTHPGGMRLVDNVRGREVDRYLYGVEPHEKFPDILHAHDKGGLHLAGDPIARLNLPTSYPNLEDNVNMIRVNHISSYDEQNAMHVVYFNPFGANGELVNYDGYKNLSQFGQYFALRQIGNKTRLYSVVNFLNPINVKLMGQISNGKTDVPLEIVSHHNKDKMNQGEALESAERIESLKFDGPVLPLLIKKYPKGRFTSKFLDDSLKQPLEISKPRGLGLALNEVHRGRVILLGAGTGVHPYCDLIDVLFKSFLVENKGPKSAEIRKMDPLASENPFHHFKFSLYMAAERADFIHPITLYQANELGKAGYLDVVAKFKSFEGDFTRRFPEIKLTEKNFETVIEDEERKGNVSKYYICGPPKFTKDLMNKFRDMETDNSLIRIL